MLFFCLLYCYSFCILCNEKNYSSAVFHKTDTSSGLSSIASLSLGFTMKMRSGGVPPSGGPAVTTVGSSAVNSHPMDTTQSPPTHRLLTSTQSSPCQSVASTNKSEGILQHPSVRFLKVGYFVQIERVLYTVARENINGGAVSEIKFAKLCL